MSSIIEYINNRERQIAEMISEGTFPTIAKYFKDFKNEFTLLNKVDRTKPMFKHKTKTNKGETMKIHCKRCGVNFQRVNTSPNVWYCATIDCPNAKLDENDKKQFENLDIEPYMTTEFFEKIADKLGGKMNVVEIVDEENDNIDEYSDDEDEPEHEKVELTPEEDIKKLKLRVKELEDRVKELEEELAKKTMVKPEVKPVDKPVDKPRDDLMDDSDSDEELGYVPRKKVTGPITRSRAKANALATAEEEPPVEEPPADDDEGRVVIPASSVLIKMKRDELSALIREAFTEELIAVKKLKSAVGSRADKQVLIKELEKKRADRNYSFETIPKNRR